jgi:hypothetical protein
VTWSISRQTEKFDVLAITDHILQRKIRWRGSALPRWARRFSRMETSTTSMADIQKEADGQAETTAVDSSGAEIAKSSSRKTQLHVVALGIKTFISADDTAADILKEIRRQNGLSIVSSASSHHHPDGNRDRYLWDHRKELSHLVDVWEAANRDDLFSVTSLKHYPRGEQRFSQGQTPVFLKTLVRSAKTWPAIKSALRANVDAATTLFRKESWATA